MSRFEAPVGRAALVAVVVLVFFAIGLFFNTFYIVNQTEQALITQFGEAKGIVNEPGLHAKLPWQTVWKFDKRLLNLDVPSEEVIAQDKKRIVVDAFARWRIVDPLQFYQTLVNESYAGARLAPILSSNIRRVLGAQNFAEMLSARRAQLMYDIRDDLNDQVRGYGIVVEDVRIRAADLPPENSEAIYNRMRKEREREAAEYRAEGDETAERIRARAAREVTVIKAEAQREAEVLHGEGDAEKTRILADAYNQDPDFFAFFRSMEAYKDALPGDTTTVVLSPNSEFFRYFGAGPGAGGKKK
jgi:membrane protease subunit HflC